MYCSLWDVVTGCYSLDDINEESNYEILLEGRKLRKKMFDAFLTVTNIMEIIVKWRWLLFHKIYRLISQFTVKYKQVRMNLLPDNTTTELFNAEIISVVLLQSYYWYIPYVYVTLRVHMILRARRNYFPWYVWGRCRARHALYRIFFTAIASWGN